MILWFEYIRIVNSKNICRTPGGDFIITDIAIDSKHCIVGTASNSGDFALWSVDDSEQSVRKGSKAWKKFFQVPGHHGDSLTCIAFSSDGSLVAVSSDHRASGGVSLWDTSSFSLRGELPCAFKRDRLRNDIKQSGEYLFFIPSSPLLVLVCSLGIAVYNIMSLSIIWSSNVSGITNAAADPHSNHWAIVVSESNMRRSHLQANTSMPSNLLLFQGSSRKPRAGWLIVGQDSFLENNSALNLASRTSLKSSATSFQPGITLAFVPENTRPRGNTQNISVPGCSPIIVFSQNRNFSLAVNPEIECVDEVVANIFDDHITGSHGFQMVQGDPAHLYNSIFGQSTKTDNVIDNDVGTSSRMLRRKLALFDLPTPALPSISNLCLHFLENMLEP